MALFASAPGASARSRASVSSAHSSTSFAGAPSFRPVVAPVQSFKVLDSVWDGGGGLKPPLGESLFGLSARPLSASTHTRRPSVLSQYSRASSCGSMLMRLAGECDAQPPTGVPPLRLSQTGRAYVPLSSRSSLSSFASHSTRSGYSALVMTPSAAPHATRPPMSARGQLVMASVSPDVKLGLLSPRAIFFSNRILRCEMVVAKRAEEAEKAQELLNQLSGAVQAARVQQAAAFVLTNWHTAQRLRAQIAAQNARRRRALLSGSPRDAIRVTYCACGA